MNKKIGFWHWLFIQPIRIILWILGAGKEASKGSLIQRTGLFMILWMVLSFPILLVYDLSSGLILSNFHLFTIPTICFVPGFIVFTAGTLYEIYQDDVKGKG